MKLTENELLFIANETNVELSFVKYYYNIIYKLPCIINGTEENFINCLLLLINSIKDGTSMDLPTDYYIDDALYKTYGDASVPNLSLFYIAMNKIQLEEVTLKLQNKKPQNN